uniref:Uncharacterized protein n=1 Tax=Pseudo-nitzschia australis TaxID=44445 RepID=A0A7S4AX13_9STRA
MGAKAVYRSINDRNVGQIGLGTRIKRRLRLKGLFGKKDNVNPHETKLIKDENRSIDDTTVGESPIKEKESDSYSQEFDVYFASSFLPHVNVAENDATDRGSKKNSVHWKAFMDAEKMLIPPSPPKKARARKETLNYQYPTNNEREGKIRPTNLTKAFQNEVVTAITPFVEQNKHFITAVQSPPKTIVAMTDKPKESPPNPLNKAKDLFTFDGDLVDTVDKSQGDFNKMLNKMSSETRTIQLTNPFSNESIVSSHLKSEMNGTIETEGETTETDMPFPRTMKGIAKYFSQLQIGPDETSDASFSCEDTYGTTGTTVFQELVRSKDAIAKLFSSMASEPTQRNPMQPSCQTNIWSFLDCANTDTLVNKVGQDRSKDLSNSPLDHSWFSVYEDSDTISKLSLPTESYYDVSLSMVSEVSPIIRPTIDPMARTGHDEMCF